MGRLVILLVAALAGSLSFEAEAMFPFFQTQQVPIGRLFTNLQQRLARDTNNFELTYDLARLHSMAYSTNLASIGVTLDYHRTRPTYDWIAPSRPSPPQ
jgi:hypothetical protein